MIICHIFTLFRIVPPHMRHPPLLAHGWGVKGSKKLYQLVPKLSRWKYIGGDSGGDTKGWRTTHRNQNLVGKLVFWVHFLSSNNPRKTSQECFGALKSDEIMRTTTFGIKHLVSDLSDEDTGAQSQVLMALSLELEKLL